MQGSYPLRVNLFGLPSTQETHPNKRQDRRNSHKTTPRKGTTVPLAQGGGGGQGCLRAAAGGADPEA